MVYFKVCLPVKSPVMKNKAAAILQKPILALKRVFGCATRCQYPTVRNIENCKVVLSQHAPMNECYYCNGSGFVQGSFEFEEFMIFRNLGTTSRGPAVSCPVCKGRGHIEA